ncbi:MAG: hypothetical protein PHT07_18270 [Paludibacter sp.]|nr:hypothetical protein [Paludibacter sp.]
MNIALITEGVSEHRIIRHIIERYLTEIDNVAVNQIEPEINHQGKQVTYGGWLNVLNVCNADKFREILSFNDCIVIQIDTDVCEEVHFDVSKTTEDSDLKTDDVLLNDVVKRILSTIPAEQQSEFKNKIIYAICINETECWLLPLYYSNNDRCKTTGCIKKLNQKLARRNEGFIPDKDKNSTNAQRTYQTILKQLKRKQDVKDCSQYNFGFDFFIQQLDDLIAKQPRPEVQD